MSIRAPGTTKNLRAMGYTNHLDYDTDLRTICKTTQRLAVK